MQGQQGSHQVTWKACGHPWRLQVMQAPEAALLSSPAPHRCNMSAGLGQSSLLSSTLKSFGLLLQFHPLPTILHQTILNPFCDDGNVLDYPIDGPMNYMELLSPGKVASVTEELNFKLYLTNAYMHMWQWCHCVESQSLDGESALVQGCVCLPPPWRALAHL